MRRRAITLLELMVVVFIVALTLSLVIPALYTSHCGPGMRWAQCANDIKSLALATANYSTVHGVFPASTTAWPGRESNHSWTAVILQDLDQADLYHAYNFDVPNYDPANGTVVGTKLWTLVCPANPLSTDLLPSASVQGNGAAYPAGSAFAPGHYGANWGGARLPGFGDAFAATQGNYRGVMMPVGVPTPRGPTGHIRPKDVVDGLATTILIGEKCDSQGWAVGGYAGSEFDAATSPLPPDRPDVRTVVSGSFHSTGIANFAFADGSVRGLRGSMNRKVWYALLTRDGGEAVSRDDY